MIQRILETLYAFLIPRSFLKPGQLLWMAVANDGKKHGGQPMKEIPQVPVVLDLVARDDLQQLAKGEKYINVRRRGTLVSFSKPSNKEACSPKLTCACINLVSRGLIGLDIGYFQKTEHRLLPYRGTVQDAGGTVSHKAEAVRLFENGHLEPDICTMLSPAHTLAAVENYVQSYKNILKLLRRDFSPLEISGILSMSKAWSSRMLRSLVNIIQISSTRIHIYIPMATPTCDLQGT